MAAIITVFKTELIGKDDVLPLIEELSDDLVEIALAYTFSPKSGKLYELLNHLKERKVVYGTHFNSSEQL